jgi:DNA polymerase-3 subunit delta
MSEVMALLEKRLAQSAWPAVILISGADEALKSRVIDWLGRQIDNAASTGAIHRFRAVPVARVLDTCRTRSLLAERQLVIARDVEGFAADGTQAARDEWSRYLDRPEPSTLLVLVVEKVDGRLALIKRIAKEALHLACELPSEREVVGWLAARGRDFGLKLTPAALQLLADAIGVDTSAAEAELKKLALVHDDPQRIVSDREVEAVLGPTRAVGAFAFEDALLQADRIQAERALGRHLAQHESGAALALLGRVAGIVRRLALARSVVVKGGGEDQVRAALGTHPFVAAKYTRAARTSGVDCDRALALCVRADLALKSGKDGVSALHQIVWTLTARGDTASHRGPNRGRA